MSYGGSERSRRRGSRVGSRTRSRRTVALHAAYAGLGFLAVILLAIGALATLSVAGVITLDGGFVPKLVPRATGTDAPGATTTMRASAEPVAASNEPTPTPPKPKEIEIGWVGDLTPGSQYGQPPEAGRALFAGTREQLQRPDLMIANLEGTFGDGGASKCDGRDSSACFAFQAPPKNAGSLAWAGIDAVNVANNHSNDYFGAGLKTTKSCLDKSGIAYTGLPDQITIREADGVKVAMIGVSPYPWSEGIANIEAVQALVRAACERADVVVVLMHAGAEGADKTHTPKGAEHAYGEFRGEPRAFSHAMIDAGADLVLGSGPHVVRGIERYDGKLIAYSLGNFAGWRNFNRIGDLALSGLLTVRVNSDGDVLGGRWLSLRLAEPGVPKVDPDHDSAKLVRELSAEDFTDTFALDAKGRFEARVE